jgi:putative FmdB family regulatory protein
LTRPERAPYLGDALEVSTVPTYEFECQKCGKEFELILSLKQYEQKEFACPACQAKEVEALVTATNVITSRKS